MVENLNKSYENLFDIISKLPKNADIFIKRIIIILEMVIAKQKKYKLNMVLLVLKHQEIGMVNLNQ